MDKTRDPEQIDAILKRVVGQIEIKDVARAWAAAVDKNIQAHATPVMLDGRVLVVEVDSSPWLYEITTRHKQRILAALQRELKECRLYNIKLRIGKKNHG